MEKDMDGDDWEDIEEAVGEFGDEEEEYIPPGYQAAEGPFKSYCTCDNFVTCSFCSWFYKIKDCKRHGQATSRPFKSCTCPSSAQYELNFEEDSKSEKLLKQPEEKVRDCVCVPKTKEVCKCDCLNFLRGEPGVKGKLPRNQTWHAEDLKDENEEFEVGVFEGDFVEEDGEWEMLDEGIPSVKQESTIKQDTITKKEGFSTVGKTCTCKTLPLSMSGSSTEIETDSEKSSCFSHYSSGDPELGDYVSGSETASEQSSAESAPFDVTKIKWVNYASDRSVESLTEDELDESEIDRIAAHWGIRNIYGRIPHATTERKEKREQMPTKDGTVFQYLVVQHNRNKVIKQNCKKKKDKPTHYYYKLLELQNK